MDKLDAQPEFTKAPWEYLDRWSAMTALPGAASC